MAFEEESFIGSTPEIGGINPEIAVTAGIWLIGGYIGYKLVTSLAKKGGLA